MARKMEEQEVIEPDLEKVLEQESEADAAAAGSEPDTDETAEIDYGSPEQIAIYDAATVEQVNAKEVIVAELEAEWKAKHSAASEAKKEFEAAELSLRKLIRERKDQRGKAPPKVQQEIPFEGDDDSGDHDPADPSEFTNDGSALGQLYEKYPITFDRWGRWGLTAKDVEKLNGGETKEHGTHPILVLGDVSKFITPNPANPSYARTLKDFKGLGDKGFDRWQEAELLFWKWWNDGGAVEFAKEMGVGNGNESAAGTGSEGAGDGEQSDSGEADPVVQGRDIEAEFAADEAVRKADGKPKRKRKAA